ncbi:hypothetical protein [Marinobacter salarius]|uniref:Uncharacterized protein n=1 Tax=Marinobacter salarius TaxID=1420917 RepID=A0A1W6KFW1_9GAMM|nr:hypothetical protein MARSALSMR5_04192 [Marinobacter salarius]
MRVRHTLCALAVGVAVSSAPTTVQASPGFAAGFAAGCATCAGAASGAFGAINASLTISEQMIGRFLNEGIYATPAPIGFPMLQAQIQASSAKTSSGIVGQIGRTTKSLRSALITATSQKVAVEGTIDSQKPTTLSADSNGGCQSLSYGAVTNIEPRSSLGWGYQYVTTGKFETENGERVGDSVNPPTSVPTDADGMKAQMSSTAVIASQVTNSDFQALKAGAGSAGQSDATVPEILDPSILFNDKSRTLSIEPDEYGISDDQRADYLIQYLNVDAPTHADALATSAVTPAQQNQAAKSQIHDMKFGIAMKAMDDHLKFRRARSQATDADIFLANAMGQSVPDVTSNEDFWHRLTHYRQRDSQWLTQTAVDDEYALAQQVQMEAEALAMKWERWKTKRTKVLLLSQVVSNAMEKESDNAK